jgi:uncharacterized membrane protein YfcA
MPPFLWAGMPPMFAHGTKKLQSVFGTAIALRNYARSGMVDWRANRLSMLLAFAGAVAGALLVQSLRPRLLELIVPILLIASALYVLVSPRMTDDDAHQRLDANGYAPVGGAIGFYDGFFGPGAGTFYTTSLVALRGLGLTRATATAKLINLTSASASLLFFTLGGHIYWLLGLCMAAGAMAGGWLGSHSAMRHGARIIRPLLVVTSLALTAKLLWSYFVG